MGSTFKTGSIYLIELNGLGMVKALCTEANYPIFLFSCEGGEFLELNSSTQAFCLRNKN